MKSSTTYQPGQSIENNYGYSLVEVLSVLVVLSLVMAVGIQLLSKATSAGRYHANEAYAKNINNAVQALKSTNVEFTKGEWRYSVSTKATSATIALPAVPDVMATASFIKSLQDGISSHGMIISIPTVLDPGTFTYRWELDRPIFQVRE